MLAPSMDPPRTSAAPSYQRLHLVATLVVVVVVITAVAVVVVQVRLG